MGWYYSTSERVIAVPVGNGEIVGVRPYTHVFVDQRLESRAEIRRFVSRGLLQRSGSPGRGAKKAIPAQPIARQAIKLSGAVAFSESIVAETSASKMKPVAEEPRVSTPEGRATPEPEAAEVETAAVEVEEAKEETPKPKRTRRGRKSKSSTTE